MKLQTEKINAIDIELHNEIGLGGVTASDFISELKSHGTARLINLSIHSPGGNMLDGLAMYNALKAHPAKIHAHVAGIAASAASTVLMAGDVITMSEWVASFHPDRVVMESTGIYWKSPYAALEKHGLKIDVVNARHVKQVPGRKTDLLDAQWLAILALNGLLRGGFVPPVEFRELRLISRQMQKLTGILSGEKNRLHKLLTDAGIRLSVVLSDLNGKSARAMIK